MSSQEQMASASMELEFSPSAIQGIHSSIRVREQCFGVPSIEITHHIEERSILQNKSRNEKAIRNVMALTSQQISNASEKPEYRTCGQCGSNPSQRVSCANDCFSLSLPLEVELNVLGVVDQGMIDRGEMAQFRRAGVRKRNSAPDITLDALTVQPQKVRPKSFTSSTDLASLLSRKSLPSTTFCSTEL